MNTLNARQRLLRAINYEEVDHIPCCFMSFSALRNRLDDDMYQRHIGRSLPLLSVYDSIIYMMSS